MHVFKTNTYIKNKILLSISQNICLFFIINFPGSGTTTLRLIESGSASYNQKLEMQH